MILTKKLVISALAVTAVGGGAMYLTQTPEAPRSLVIAATPVTWACTLAVDPAGPGCKAGAAEVCMTATTPYHTETDHRTCTRTTFPQPNDTLTLSFPDLDKRMHTVRAVIDYDDPAWRNHYSESQEVMGLGSDVPEYTPTPTPTTTPTPTPTVAPLPTITPSPTGTPAPPPANCVAVQSGTNAVGTWSLTAAGHTWLVTPDGTSTYAFPGGAGQPGAQADHYIFVNGSAYAHDTTFGYMKMLGRSQAVQETPTCSTPTPTPTTTPTPTSTPTPTPTPTPVPVTCGITVASVQGPYANGDYRFQVRAPKSCVTTPPKVGATLRLVGPMPGTVCNATITSVAKPYANGDYRFTLRAPTSCVSPAPVANRLLQVVIK